MCKLCEIYDLLSLYTPLLNSFLYVTLLIFPCLIEIMVISWQPIESTINTILICASIQSCLSVSGGVNMGYNFFCCCADKRLSDREINNMLEYSGNRTWCSSPMLVGSLFSPGYTIYFGVPWLLVNIFAIKLLPIDMCFPPTYYLLIFMPLLIYFPCFAVGSAYRNIVESSKIDKFEESKVLTPIILKSTTSLSGNLKCDSDAKHKNDADTKDIPVINLSPMFVCTPEPIKSLFNNQQLYDTKPLTASEVRGASSKTIFCFMKFGIGYKNSDDNPLDVDDFERNRALLLWYPEWRERILEMSVISKYWKVLSENWGQIEMLYEKDYLIHRKINHDESECNKYIRKLLKDAYHTKIPT